MTDKTTDKTPEVPVKPKRVRKPRAKKPKEQAAPVVTAPVVEPPAEEAGPIEAEYVDVTPSPSQMIVQEPVNASITTIPLGALVLNNPSDVIAKITEVSKELVKVVNALQLFKIIRSKKFVFVDGWEVLGGMLGVGAHEESSVRREDGSYEAVVVLKRHSDGAIVGRASAICGMDETDTSGNLTWGAREEFARKSMATTRATGKAYRLSFSWIMKLAGYEGTPAEEMKGDENVGGEEKSTDTNRTPAKPKRPARPASRDRAVAMMISYGKSKGLDSEGKDIGAGLNAAGKTFDQMKWEEMFDFVDALGEAKKNPPAPADPAPATPPAETSVDPTDAVEETVTPPVTNPEVPTETKE